MSNIQVIVRCRGRNPREVNAKSPVVIELPDDVYSISDPFITINQDSNSLSSLNESKTYKVDQVYGSQADQSLIFNKVALPLFNDFMKGFNVTILAYGQTGTGKTFTMCGDYQNDLSDEAGIIPRVLSELFKRLENDESNDFMVKCSFIELYNEELKDLLNDDDKLKLRIFERSKLKNPNLNSNVGSGSIIIQNLTEEFILNSSEGFKILRKGVLKRKTASTKLNDFSSRSHTIFTINLYKKQNHELFRVSKMNLVDLAGSENITRSGAINQRAKEAGSINQSLLTLGRVINCLSEKNLNSSHIPYRESKLTRLLQDSIGGETKTTLIATISPAKINVDETASTLDYASKAKNIKNLPQSGQDSDLVMKRIIVKDLTKEIIRLTNDLEATRNKNGIYLEENNYNLMIEENESMKVELKESNVRINGLSSKIGQLEMIKKGFATNEKIIKKKLDEIESENKTLEKNQIKLKSQLKEKDSRIQELENKLNTLSEKHKLATNHLTRTVYENLNNSISSIEQILDQINNHENSEQLNELYNKISCNLQKFKDNISMTINEVKEDLNTSLSEIPQQFNKLNNNLDIFCKKVSNNEVNLKQSISDLRIANDKLTGYINEDHLNLTNLNPIINQLIKDKVDNELSNISSNLSKQLDKILNQSKLNYENLLRNSVNEISNNIISSEKTEIFKIQKNWNMESKKLYNSIGNDLRSSHQTFAAFKTNQNENLNEASSKISLLISDKLSTNLNRVNDFMEHENDNILKNDLPKLNEINDKIIKDDKMINENLVLINKDLNEIKQFNTDSVNISPIITHSSTRSSPTKSPTKTISYKRQFSPAKSFNVTNNTLKTRIPQLNKSLLENKENLSGNSDFKRRKILQQVDNVLNK